MNAGKRNAQVEECSALMPAEQGGQSNLSWSIRRLIELIDEAIDTAGAQLARSAGLWADSPTPFDERERSSMHRRSKSVSAKSCLEESDREHRLDLM